MKDETAFDALCCTQGVMTPREIKALRHRLGLSRLELTELTGFGEATIKRWENGAKIQNQSAARFLRLLELPGVMEELLSQAEKRRVI